MHNYFNLFLARPQAVLRKLHLPKSYIKFDIIFSLLLPTRSLHRCDDRAARVLYIMLLDVALIGGDCDCDCAVTVL